MNWKLRLQNRVTLSSLIALAVAFVYQVLGWVGIVPNISQNDVLQAVSLLIEILAGLGILVDPTTQGIGDSERAMQYVMPNKPELPDDYFENAEEDGDTDGK